MRKRDKMIKITLTEEEHELLKQQAQEMGMNKSAYIRHVFMTTHPRRWKPIDWSPIIRDLEVVNEGMNRVAVQANVTGYIDEAACLAAAQNCRRADGADTGRTMGGVTENREGII